VKFVLTNDDGYGAPGLNALFAAAEGLGERIIVAPKDALSGCSHQVTTDKPLRFESRGKDVIVDGTPADCVRIALHQAARDLDWVLSGINAGGNLGADVYHSGTVAAAREAILHGKPAIALSHYRGKNMQFDWTQSAKWIAPLLRDILTRPWSPGLLWNINLPHLAPGAARPEVIFCALDPSPLPLSYRDESGVLHYDGNYHQRRRETGSDVDVCLGGRIAVTELRLF